jgi:hypothetical protein
MFRFRLETLEPLDKAILLTVPKEENVGSIVEFKGTVVKVQKAIQCCMIKGQDKLFIKI